VTFLSWSSSSSRVLPAPARFFPPKEFFKWVCEPLLLIPHLISHITEVVSEFIIDNHFYTSPNQQIPPPTFSFDESRSLPDSVSPSELRKRVWAARNLPYLPFILKSPFHGIMTCRLATPPDQVFLERDSSGFHLNFKVLLRHVQPSLSVALVFDTVTSESPSWSSSRVSSVLSALFIHTTTFDCPLLWYICYIDSTDSSRRSDVFLIALSLCLRRMSWKCISYATGAFL
jgi:hypothetical protein